MGESCVLYTPPAPGKHLEVKQNKHRESSRKKGQTLGNKPTECLSTFIHSRNNRFNNLKVWNTERDNIELWAPSNSCQQTIGRQNYTESVVGCTVYNVHTLPLVLSCHFIVFPVTTCDLYTNMSEGVRISPGQNCWKSAGNGKLGITFPAHKVLARPQGAGAWQWGAMRNVLIAPHCCSHAPAHMCWELIRTQSGLIRTPKKRVNISKQTRESIRSHFNVL